MSTEAFSETLQFITKVKFEELSKKNDRFTEHASRVLSDASAHTDIDSIARLEVFVNGLYAWPDARSKDFPLADTERFLRQARRDPALPPSIIEEWNRRAEVQFEHETTRYDFARLFGKLLNEWLAKSKSSVSAVEVESAEGDDAPQASSSEVFEKVNRKETIDQKKKLESLIFEEKEIDVEGLKEYLIGLFSSKEAKEELKKLRSRIWLFAHGLRDRTISSKELEQVIQSVLQTDMLSDGKQETLKEFLRNETVFGELQSVLNMQLSTTSSWSWPTDGVLVEPRRHLNGRTRFYLDPEILTCLLLHFLGTLWSVEFKRNLCLLRESRAWKTLPRKLDRVHHKRRDVFFGKESSDGNINQLRKQYQTDHYFMCQLPSEFKITVDHYKDEPRPKISSWAGLAGSLDRGPHFDSPLDLKQSLLHILSADIVMNKALHNKCTVVRTDLEWFGPSLPFDTITTVLDFFGVPEDHVDFMESFLSCPIMFKDDPSRLVRVRKRGVPLSYMFSTLFGELLMFIMDFAVNQRTDGSFLYRIHDDFWFWDVSSSRCADAWNEMKRFASVASLTFNLEKTGSVVIGDDELHPDLPSGVVRWGFLRMDASSDGRFVVDQAMIDEHIVELRRQLAATTSVFGWIQAYNKYMAFIVRNCGTPSIVYGKEHVDSIIDTVARVQRTVFSGPDVSGTANFTIALAKMIKNRFGVSTEDIPCGWYVWPNAVGGLEVKNSLVDLFFVRDGFAGSNVDDILKMAYFSDESCYSRAKDRWERGETPAQSTKYAVRLAAASGESVIVSPGDPFFSFEEFTMGREERGSWWYDAYKSLLERPRRASLVCTPQLGASLKLLGDGISAFGGSSWDSLHPYWQWIIAVHHDEMVRNFGSLAVVDPKAVPVGMVSVFKGSRMKWEQ